MSREGRGIGSHLGLKRFEGGKGERPATWGAYSGGQKEGKETQLTHRNPRKKAGGLGHQDDDCHECKKKKPVRSTQTGKGGNIAGPGCKGEDICKASRTVQARKRRLVTRQ